MFMITPIIHIKSFFVPLFCPDELAAEAIKRNDYSGIGCYNKAKCEAAMGFVCTGDDICEVITSGDDCICAMQVQVQAF